MPAPTWEPIAELAQGVKSGRLKAADLVKKSLQMIEAGKEYNTVIATMAERAAQRAAGIDAGVAKGKDPGRLSGVPFIAKDNFLVFGADTTAASNILKGFEAPYQSTAINRLEAEGAICVAKANLDAFGHGSSTENSDFFTTFNPHDKNRVAGGSSGGSAAAVALAMAPFSIGTDTGGSIRFPSSLCGVVGYKPSYGLVSRSGVVAMGSSLDVIGPITSSVEDAALVLDVMAGKDELDMTTIDKPAGLSDAKAKNLSELKVGLVKEYFPEGLDPDIRKIMDSAIDKLKAAGADIQEISVPSSKLALACYYILCPAEISSNLSRYDGQRYGYSYPDARDLDESYTLSRDVGFGDEAKRRIIIGTYVLSSGYYDAYYKKAQLVRTKLIRETEQAFKKCDVLIGPTAPMKAFKVGQNIGNPLDMYLTDILTVGASLSGNPAVSLPAGSDGGLPVGLQVIGKQTYDNELLSIAKSIERTIG